MARELAAAARGLLALGAALLAASATAAADPAADTALVYAHVAAAINQTFREAQGQLPFPYQVPAGPYNELWDWDACFLGISSARDFNGSRFFVGSMSNFLAKTNVTTGEVKGCLTPGGDTPTLFHAKPIIIQGAFLAAKFDGGDYAQFERYKPQMLALLAYWESPQRVDAATGLHRWHDQLETGADNLVLSLCPSPYSPECWVEELDAFTLSSPDIELFIAREHIAFAQFVELWGGDDVDAAAESAEHRKRAREIADRVDALMFFWSNAERTRGYYGGFNCSSQSQITNRVYQVRRRGRLTLGSARTHPNLGCDPRSSPGPSGVGARRTRPSRRRPRPSFCRETCGPPSGCGRRRASTRGIRTTTSSTPTASGAALCG